MRPSSRDSRNLKDQTEYQSLYLAGLSRAIGDWILGMNATRLYTLKYGQNRQVLSIGRVQTPTLALIVNRQKEIDNFVSEPYWVLATIYRDTQFTATSGKFTSKERRSVEGFQYHRRQTRHGYGCKQEEKGKRGTPSSLRPHLAAGGLQQEVCLLCRYYAETHPESLREEIYHLSWCRYPVSHRRYLSEMSADSEWCEPGKE